MAWKCHLVQHGAVGRHTAEGLVGPAGAHHPGQAGVRRGVPGHAAQVARRVVLPGEVAAQQVQPGEDGVHVGVLEARQQQPLRQIHHLGTARDQRIQVGVGADRDDRAPVHRHRGRPARPVHVPGAKYQIHT
jgi:hypothetical protein